MYYITVTSPPPKVKKGLIWMIDKDSACGQFYILYSTVARNERNVISYDSEPV